MIRVAQRKKTKVKMIITGPAGAGKTYTALNIAYGLVGDWSKIFVVCTEWQDDENTAADLYSDIGPFKIYEMKPPYMPERFFNAYHECVKAGAEVVIIDSISDEWEGTGGILQIHADLAKTKNSFTVWDELGKRHLKLVDIITSGPIHTILCARVKVEYVMEEGTNTSGKTVQKPVKKGTKVITREGLDYQVTLALDMETNHYATCSKDRLMGMEPRIIDRPAFKPDAELGKEIALWCDSGAALTDEQLEKREIATLVHDVRDIANKIGISTREAFTEITLLDSTEGKTLQQLKDAYERLSKEAIRRSLGGSEIPPAEQRPDENAGGAV